MKIKIILLQIIYFSLLLCLKFIFHTRCDAGVERVFHIQSNMEVILEILLLLGLSVCMCMYILKSYKMIYTALWICLSLSLLFEASKYIDYLLGYLPHYGDVPILIGIALTIVMMVVYVSILCLICLLWRKWHKQIM